MKIDLHQNNRYLLPKMGIMIVGGIFFFLYFFILVFNFNVTVLPVFFLITGIVIRLIFRKKYLMLFCALFPMLPGFASFENHQMPLNYLSLPLIVLVGIFLGELITDSHKASSLLSKMNGWYFAFLLIIILSLIFLILRWSNITVSSLAIFKNTPVCPDQRLSFGIIFPFLFVIPFFVSYLFRLYVRCEKDIKKLIIFFLIGFSISSIISYLQKFCGLQMFLGHNIANGLSSDWNTMGFLSAIAFLLSFYLVYRFKVTILGIAFWVNSFVSILTSSTRIGLFALIAVSLFIFIKITWKKKILFIVLILLVSINFTYHYHNMGLDKKLRFVSEVENSFWQSLKIIHTGNFQENIDDISAGRNFLWKYSLEIINQFPLSGIGPGNFIFWVMYDNYGQKYYHEQPANQYLMIATETGLLGIIVFMGFLISIIRKKRGVEFYIIICVLLILFFGNYFWMSECFLAVWLILSIGKNRSTREWKWIKKIKPWAFSGMVIIFLMGNILKYNSLHPLTWSRKSVTRYDYGFWYAETDHAGNAFRWTKAKSGVYIYLQDGATQCFEISCGAPLGRLPENKQLVDIYWRGSLYQQFVFSEKKQFRFKITDRNHSEGFLEIRVTPTFNLHKLNLSTESRDLGVKLYENLNL